LLLLLLTASIDFKPATTNTPETSTQITSIVFQEQATIFVDPALVDGLLPGDRFMINIIVTGATEVKAWEIELSFAKYMNVLAFVEAIEGDFLMMAGDETYFTYYIDAFDSLVKAACVILGQVPGVSGSNPNYDSV